jgi:hypothetical protein
MGVRMRKCPYCRSSNERDDDGDLMMCHHCSRWYIIKNDRECKPTQAELERILIALGDLLMNSMKKKN